MMIAGTSYSSKLEMRHTLKPRQIGEKTDELILALKGCTTTTPLWHHLNNKPPSSSEWQSSMVTLNHLLLHTPQPMTSYWFTLERSSLIECGRCSYWETASFTKAYKIDFKCTRVLSRLIATNIAFGFVCTLKCHVVSPSLFPTCC